MNTRTNGAVPPEQVHDLLNNSIEQIAQGWINQLTALRRNTEQLESLLLSHVATAKANISRLHELGEQVAAEAERGRQVCEQLAIGIEQLTQSPGA